MTTKRKTGDKFGCSDGPKPESTSEERLSRLLDALDALTVAFGDTVARKAFRDLCTPSEMMDFTWSKWAYVAAK